MKYRLILIFLAIVGLAVAQQRVPASPKPFVVTQPNGDTLSVRLVGDEWQHRHTTLDGYPIVQNKRGYWCYARPTNPQHPSCRKAHNEPQRTRCEQRWLNANQQSQITNHK